MISYDGDVLSPYESVLMRKFRPEIQLLRAVAVLAVVVYHIQPSWLPGGFVGVDVFFVISGYLITAHMLKEVESTGRLSLSQFWANRARRILPAATLAIVAISIVLLFVLPSTQLIDATKQGIASALYIQNFLLANQSVDYLGQDVAPSPFQHFWSLSVEEQFYVVWPLLVLAALWMSKRAGSKGRHASVNNPERFRAYAFVLFSAVCVISFVWSVVTVGAGDPAAYFITPTRVWELGIGGLLACVLGDPHRFNSARKVLAVVGLVAIAVACVTYTSETPAFPGASALLPTVGTVAMIAAGWTRGVGSLSPIINWKPVQLVGLWSYSLYLWHFPVVVFFHQRNGRPVEGITEFIAVFAVSLALAMLSFYYVEQPLRSLSFLKKRSRRALVAAGTSMAVTCGVAVVPFASHSLEVERETRKIEALKAGDVEDIGSASLSKTSFNRFAEGYSDTILPVVPRAIEDRPYYPDDCPATPAEPETKTAAECVMANPGGSKTLALVGDSHASQWVPAFQEMLKGTDWKLVVHLHYSCPFNLAKRGYENDGRLECTEPNKKTIEKLKDEKPDRAVIANMPATDFEHQDDEDRPGQKGYTDAMRPLTEAGIDLTVLGDTPVRAGKTSIPDCIAKHQDSGDYDKCDLSSDDVSEFREAGLAVRDASEDVGAQYIDVRKKFCTEQECPVVVGNVLVYRDHNHVSATYVRTLTPFLHDQLRLES
ncbi:acyltransferase family protein [uncultured Brevibacterium sp.]